MQDIILMLYRCPLKITFLLPNGKLLGAQIVGYNGVDKRIDEFSQVIKHNGTVYDLMGFGAGAATLLLFFG